MSSRPGFEVPAVKQGGEWSFNQQRFKELASRLKDGNYTLTVEKFVESGTRKQRAYYHGVIVREFAEYWGVDDEDAHELIKQNCNKKTVEIVNKETGETEEKVIAASTAGMNKEEWKAFIDRCHRWAATEFDFVIPDPDPEYALHRYEAAAKQSV